MKSRLPRMALSSAGTTFAVPAWAQDDNASAHQLECAAMGDIIVGARRREDCLHDVSASNSAFYAKARERSIVLTMGDVRTITSRFAYSAAGVSIPSVPSRSVCAGGSGPWGASARYTFQSGLSDR